MDSFDEQLALPPFSLLALAAAGMCLVLLAPPRSRLRWSLIQLPVVMTIGRLLDLGDLAYLAKSVSGVALGVVALAAMLHPGPRRAVSSANWLFVGLGLLSVLLVSGALDWPKAMAYRAQWTLLSLTALLICRTLVDRQALRSVAWGLYQGCAVSTLLTLSPLMLHPSSAFAAGLGRFQPYGCNPVQIGVLYVCTVPLGLYFATTSQGIARRACLLITILAACAAILTVSRMAIALIVISSVPCLTRLTRRPIVVAGAFLGAGVLASYFLTHYEEANVNHLQAARGEQRLAYMMEVLEEVGERPWLGLWKAENLYAHSADLNAHSSYLEMLYLGGIVYGGPTLLLILLALFGAFRAVLGAGCSSYGRLLTRTLAALYFSTIINGFVNFITNYSTYTFTFMHVLLAHFFLAMLFAGAPGRVTRRLPTRPLVVPPDRVTWHGRRDSIRAPAR